jgi:hypothetical protein
MKQTFTREEVVQLEDQQMLRYYYTFDDLPDPNNLVAPVGFASVMGRPIGYYASPWWGNAAPGVRSEWYDDYRWMPFIENLVAHRPLTLPLDATLPAVETDTNGVTRARYPNDSNPYTLWYRTGTQFVLEDHPFLGNDGEREWGAEGMWGELPIAPDLLPCGLARTDESVPLWDNDTPGSADYDSDDDGMPDDWELANGLDPNDPADAALDPDGDGLSNLVEWKIGSDPNNTHSLNPLVSDRNWDSDGDGLSNYDEAALHGTDPANPDTDDDGVSDGEEVSNLSNPVYARSPVHARSLDIQGTHYLIPEGTDSDTGRFDLEAWTVEFWVYPRQAGMDATLVERRHADIAGNIQFGMALEDGVPLVRFTTAGGHVYQAKAADALPVNAWKHLAGVWDPERDTLELYVDGIRVMAQACVEQPARGLGTTRLGDTGGALFAYVDDVRIWGIARMAEEIAMNHDTFAGFMTVGDQAANYEGILFPNGAVAFADEVVHFVVGDGDGFVPNAHTDASQALGAPDDGFVSLGISDITSVTNAGGIGYQSSKGYLVVQFKDNVVQRSWDARPDLVIFEGADRKDSFYVWVSIDGDQFYFAGFAEGGTSLIDLDYYLSRLENHEDIDGIQYVQIVDSGMNTWSTLGMPGADIKAVAALNHSVMPLAWYPFDDGQNESLVNPLSGLVEQYGAQDFVHLRDWENDWRHAIRLSDLNTNALVFNDTIVPAYSTFDSDADGLPDEFEAAFDLDPFNADENGNGVLDGWDDFDLDGLSNYAEWLAGTHPWNPDTDGDGISDYEDISVGSARMNGVRFTDNDHVEDHWEARAVDGYASPYRYDEHLDLDGDGWINWSEARTGTRPDTEYNEPVAGAVGTASYPQPPLLVTLDYPGVRDRSSATPMLVVHAYTDAYMNGKPDAVYALPLPSPGSWPKNLSLTTNELHAGHLRQGRNYFQAFIDLDGSVGAIAGPTWTLGEPAAIADGHDKGIDIGWDRNEVRFGLTDAARNFARFSWEDSPYASPDVNRVSILNGSGTEIFVRYFSAPRTWLHEGDLIAGKEQNFGLGWGQVFPPRHIFTWRLNGAIESSQTFTNDYLASLPVPATVAPKNDVLAGARTTYLFRLHPEATEFEFELRRGTIGGTVVYSGRHLAPSRGIYDTLDGSTLTDVCSWRFPYHAGDVLPSGQIFSNDTYYWRVRGFSPTTAAGTAWSDQPSFRLDVNAGATDGAGKGWLTVNVRYPGAAGLGGGAPIRVQAFATRAFNGIPDAEKQISAVGSVTLAGLDPGVYYIRAYVDQNNNRRRDFWESYGYYRSETDPVEPFRVKDVQVVALGMSQPLTVTIRDADTDNDKIPDAIEYLMHGAGGGDWLAVAGPGPIASSDPYTDFDGDGLNDLSELDAGTRWDLADSDGDGIPDRLDRDLFGVDQVGEIQMLQLTGLDPAAGTLGWRWTTEAALGSGLQPLAAPDTPMRSLGTSAAYIVEFTTSLTERVWQPVTNLSSDAAGGQLSLPRTVSPSGFYRIRMLAE